MPRVDSGAQGAGDATGGSDFGATLQQALQGAVERREYRGHQVDGGAERHRQLDDVVSAVARAQLALQTASAVRDRVVQAYQDL